MFKVSSGPFGAFQVPTTFYHKNGWPYSKMDYKTSKDLGTLLDNSTNACIYICTDGTWYPGLDIKFETNTKWPQNDTEKDTEKLQGQCYPIYSLQLSPESQTPVSFQVTGYFEKSAPIKWLKMTFNTVWSKVPHKCCTKSRKFQILSCLFSN